MSLITQVWDSPSKGELLGEFNARLHPAVGGQGFRFGTNKHGFSLYDTPIIPQVLEDAFMAYDWYGTPHVEVLDDAAQIAWRGRVEDLSVVDGGAQLSGLGYWRAFRDVPYTALWSDTEYGSWRALNEIDKANRKAEKFAMDQDNRLFVGLRKNEVYGNTTALGSFIFWAPHNGERDIAEISFDYTFDAASNWRMQTASWTDDLASFTVEDQTDSGGSPLSGTKTLTIAANRQAIEISMLNNTGGNYTHTGETGAAYLEITNIRVKTTTSSSVLASDIAAALVAHVNGFNSSQISAITALIEATSQDLQLQLYEDAWPADLLDELALLHGYEAAVWDSGRLSFRPIGTDGIDWYVDVSRIVHLQRSLEHVRNSAYAVYQDENGRTRRTAVSVNQASIDRHALTRRGFVHVSTTDASEAQAHRDAFLTDRHNYALRAAVEFERLHDGSGADYPLYMLRSGDTITMRNLPPSLSAEIDNIRKFRVGETEFDALTGRIYVAPREGLPTIVGMVSKATATEAGEWDDIFTLPNGKS